MERHHRGLRASLSQSPRLHAQVRYSSNNRQPTMDKKDQQVANARTGQKRRRPTTERLGETQLRWEKLTDNTKWRSRAGGGSTPSTLSSHFKEKQENVEERDRQVEAQSNAVKATNTGSTSRTERRSDSNHTRKSHERRVRQSEI